MAHKFKRRDRVRILSGRHAGKSARLDRLHGGKGFARVWLVWLDGTDWDAPSYGVPEAALEKVG